MARKLSGTVVSDVQDKTIVVQVDRRVSHPIYKKQFNVSKKYQAHDEKNQAKKGDIVSIGESKPISKTKTWKLIEVVSRKAGAGEEVVS